MHYLFALCLLLGLIARTGAADLQAFTEEFPPFNHVENGRHRGLANEILERIMQRSGLAINRESLPWARAVQKNEQTANSILYTTVRTAARDPNYRWVGPYDSCDIVLLKLKSRSDVHASNLAEARQYTIGAMRGGAGFQLLEEAGVPPENMMISRNEANSVRMLYAERFELSAGLVIPHRYIAKQLGLDPAQLVPAFTLQKGDGCYFAFNRKVDPQLFARFERAFQALQNSGELAQLQQRYLADPAGNASLPGSASRPKAAAL
ncbi:substrate-binding periplasmic protein [Chitinilyticum litopenaei]|uniref:substrate-binding periplasmic protein n=1 Tax=Chitinilyticum litopenaei TaxID=1121276 RepID=UPI00040085F6|nr:transporter substrate-binding domain-containing protein [Chitinilyticum litopenaei]